MSGTTSVDAYLAALPADQRAELNDLRAIWGYIRIRTG